MRAAVLSLFLLAPQEASGPRKVDFVRDIQPLFKARCLKPHGSERPKGPREIPVHVRKAIETPFDHRSNTNRNDLLAYCRSQAPPELQPQVAKLLGLYARLDQLDVGTALVLKERPGKEPPSARVRIKGGFVNVGERVTAGVPASLHPLPPGTFPNRLALAHWLVSRENPLAARVAVNRYGGEFFFNHAPAPVFMNTGHTIVVLVSGKIDPGAGSACWSSGLLPAAYQGVEFGRTPMNEGRAATYVGRDRHPRAFTMWLAGGGVKPGVTVGATDELGDAIVEDPVYVLDLRATVLHLMGIEHTRLTYRFQGRDYRLTDVHGQLVTKLLA